MLSLDLRNSLKFFLSQSARVISNICQQKSASISILGFLIGINTLHSENINTKSYIVKIKESKQTELQNLSSKFLKPIFSNIIRNKSDEIQSIQQKDLNRYFKIEDISKLNQSELDLLKQSAEFIEPNYTFKIEQADYRPNDPKLSDQWGLSAVNAFKAWNIATGKGIIVGVVDTGIDFEHPDLKDKLWINTKEDINGNGIYEPWSNKEAKDGIYGDIDGIDNDGNGITDDVIGYDFVDQDLRNTGDSKSHDPIPADEHSHGTIVSGVIAAKSNNGIGISGLAFDAKIMTARAFDASGNAESDDISNAIIYLVENGAKVINCSFGEKNYSRLNDAAIRYATDMGVVVVASSGNNGWDSPHYPSDLENVISVGASTSENKRLYLSNYGHNLSLLAPGSGIMTTRPNNTYGEASGTSLSAPFVTAATAMLLEKNPKLNYKQIRSILEATATPLKTMTRNNEEGAGLLNVYSALQYPNPVELSISEPSEFQVFKIVVDKDIVVIGTVSSPLFDSYSVKIENQLAESGADKTYPIYTSTEQKINDTLAVFKNIGRALLVDNTGKEIESINGQMRITLSLNQKNGKTIEKPILIEILNNQENLAIDSVSISPIYYEENQKYVVGFKSNMNSFAKVQVIFDGEVVQTINDDDNYCRYHAITLDNLIDKANYKIRIISSRLNGETITIDKDLTAEISSFIKASFSSKKTPGLPAGYMINQVTDLDNDNKQEIMLCDYDDGNWHGTQIFKYDNDKFNKIENSDSLYLPVGFGNINGNDNKDILAKRYRDNRVLEVSDGKYLQNITYRDEQFRTALALYDIDKDGKDEIICHNDYYFDVVKEQNGKYNTIASTKESSPTDLSSSPGVTVGDFDNDGKIEIVHSNKKGNIIISEFENNSFKVEYTDLTEYPSDVHSLEKADLDGDGVPEIIFLTVADLYQTPESSNSALSEQKTKIWKAKVYKSTSANTYKEQKQLALEFLGPRTGDSGYGFYKNGIISGNVDGKIGDEVIFSLYPNFYIFKYESNQLKPFAIRRDAFANSAMIYDFNGNGINEIIYSTFYTSHTLEYVPESETYIPPAQVWGWATDTKNYYLKWIKPANSITTQIWKVSFSGSLPDQMLAETSDNSYTITNINENMGAIYLKSKYDNDSISYPTKHFFFYANEAIEPMSVNYLGHNLSVKFNGAVAYKAEADYFKLTNGNDEIFTPNSINYSGENSYTLYFADELPAGNYQLQVASFFDYYTNPSKQKTLNFSITKEIPKKELYLKSLNLLSLDDMTVKLKYSEPINEMALNIENYTLSPIGEIIKIERMPETDSTVKIYFAKNDGIGALGKEYSITVKNVKNTNGDMTITDGMGNTLSFVLFAETPNTAYIYPNPIRSTDDQLPVFANLPSRATVTIYTLEGELLNTLTESDANGGIEWNLCDSKGIKLNAGVYLFKVEDFNGNTSELKKFAIVR